MSNEGKLNHFLFGAVAGLGLAQLLKSDNSLSRTEKDDPDFAEEVSVNIAELLDEWEPGEYQSEDEYTNDLFDYLAECTEYEIEMFPNTRFGVPDLLIEDILVLELKLNPNKSERDRLVGQCAGYSREWATWAILIDSSASQYGELRRLLEDKGLEHIAVWAF